MWCVIINRKLKSPTIYGPYADYEEACDIERHVSRNPLVSTISVLPISAARLDENGRLVTTAYL